MDMKKILMICALGLGVLAAASCCKCKNEVTALVAGPENAVVALAIEYAAPICPKSVSPEAFEVEGREVVCAKACKEHVIVFLKPEGEMPCCKEGQPEKPCCPEECCGEDKPCHKEGAPCCDKPECCKNGGKPCCKEGQPEGEKPCCKKECEKIAVPKIAVKQVADLKDAEGNVVPAWSKPVKACEAKPLPKHKCHEKHECDKAKPDCEEPCEKPCDKPCDKPCGE